jgi:hypothetical protein
MPKFKITMSPPDASDEIIEKTIFISEEEFVKRVAPVFYELNFKIHEVKEVHSVFDKQVIQAKLDSGKEVNLLKFGFHLTYGDLLEGDPDQETNERILESLRTKFSPDYIPTHIRRPSEDKVKGELPVLYGVTEWANYKKTDKEGLSSELRVVWFMDEVPEGLAFRQMLQESLRGLDWDRYVGEYDAGSL